MIKPGDSKKDKDNDAPSIPRTIHPAKYEDVEGKLPLLVIEETKPSYKREGDSHRCRDNGGLSRERARHIVKVHVIERSHKSIILIRYLDRMPHYEIKQNDLEVFMQDARRNCLTVHHHEIKLDVPVNFSLGLILNFSDKKNDLSPETVSIRNILQEMNDRETARRMLDGDYTAESDPSKRNSLQAYFGYCGNQSMKVRNGKAVPNLITKNQIDDLQRSNFVNMTKAGDRIFELHQNQSRVKVPGKFMDDSDHGGERIAMARVIHKDNKATGLTLSLVKSDEYLVQIHCDTSNDSSEIGVKSNLHWTVITNNSYMCSRDGLVHLRKIIYSKQSISDYVLRDEALETLYEEDFLPWFKAQPWFRQELSLKRKNIFCRTSFRSKDFEPIRTDNGDIVLPPLANKHAGFLSGFIDAFRKTLQRVPYLKSCVHKQIELMASMVFFCTAAPYRTILLEKWKGNFPSKDKNLVVCMLREVVNDYGSVSGGDYPRIIARFNKHVSHEWIRNLILTLRDIVEDCSKDSRKDSNIESKRLSFSVIETRLCRIPGIGMLGAQHLLHFLALVNLIPARYGLDAKVCVGTRACKRLQHKNGKAINPNSFHTYMSTQLRFPKSLAENLCCKWLIDANKRGPVVQRLRAPGHFDVIYHDQDVVRYCETINGNAIVIELRRDSRGKVSHPIESYDWKTVGAMCRREKSSPIDYFWDAELTGRQSKQLSIIEKVHSKSDDHAHKSITNKRKQMRQRKVPSSLWGIHSDELPIPVTTGRESIRRRVEHPHDPTIRFFARIDKAMQKEEERRLLNDYYADMDSAYADSEDHYLRHLHQNATELFTSKRTSVHTSSQFKGCHKNPTHLENDGVLSFPFRLDQAAAEALGVDHDEMSKKTKLYHATHTIGPNKKAHSFSHPDFGQLTYRHSMWALKTGYIRGNEALDDPIMYTNEGQAKTAYLWYLATRHPKSVPERWVWKRFGEDDWTALGNNKDQSQEFAPKHLKLTSSAKAGELIAILTIAWDPNKAARIYCTMEKRKTNKSNFDPNNTVRFKVCNSPYGREEFPHRDTSSRRRMMLESVSMPKSKSEVTDTSETVSKSEVTSTILSENPPLTPLQKLAEKSVLVTIKPHAPFAVVVDEENQHKLRGEWKPFFGDCSDYWTMISTGRKTKSSNGNFHHDKYLFPPGFGIKLRSNNELFRFLKSCAKQCEITAKKTGLPVPTPDAEYSLYKSFFDKVVAKFLESRR